MSDWILQHLKPFAKHDPTQPVYLRYGLWPRRSRNAETGQPERGISVYRAQLIDGVVELTEEPSLQLQGQGRVVFVVQGKLVNYGSDGEPVLQGIKMVRLPISIEAKRI